LAFQECTVVTAPVAKKVDKPRPENWYDIANYATYMGVTNAIKFYEADMSDYSYRAARLAVSRWIHDLADGKAPTDHLNSSRWRSSIVGNEIEQIVVKDLQVRSETGLVIDNSILRRLIKEQLAVHEKSYLLAENGGVLTLGDSWACRFWKRHALVIRVSATKTTPVPADFEAKKSEFIRIGAEVIATHSIPDELVFNCDETSVQLVSIKNRTRAPKGAKRVPLISMGHSNQKMCITCTHLVSAAGATFPAQTIFKGKSPRCLPPTDPPTGYQTYTDSHWQTPASFLDYIERIVIPAKKRICISKGLNVSDQHALLMLDLHYSHTNPNVIQFLKSHKIVPLYIPGGCTDLMQVCMCMCST
jgi:hypothetical protein